MAAKTPLEIAHSWVQQTPSDSPSAAPRTAKEGSRVSLADSLTRFSLPHDTSQSKCAPSHARSLTFDRSLALPTHALDNLPQNTESSSPATATENMQVLPRFAVLFVALLARSVHAESIGTVSGSVHAYISTSVQPPNGAVNKLPFEGVSCTPVNVKGDATYCISGRVCSGSERGLAGTNCPKRGDIALSGCWNTLKSYDSVLNNCLAPVDAQCVMTETGTLGCVFPDVESVAVDQEAAVSNRPVDIGATVQTSALSAKSDSTYTASVSTENQTDVGRNAASGAVASAAVAAVVLVVAVAGIALVKRRRDERQSRDNSTRNLSCMELSTPV